MDYSDLTFAQSIYNENNRKKHGENPLATREMFAVRGETRSLVTVIRNAVVRLFAAKNESVR